MRRPAKPETLGRIQVRAPIFLCGGRSSKARAPDCGSGGCGFKIRRSPHLLRIGTKHDLVPIRSKTPPSFRGQGHYPVTVETPVRIRLAVPNVYTWAKRESAQTHEMRCIYKIYIHIRGEPSVCSYLYVWRHRLRARTPPFQGGNTGSNPVGATNDEVSSNGRTPGLGPGNVGSNPTASTMLLSKNADPRGLQNSHG